MQVMTWVLFVVLGCVVAAPAATYSLTWCLFRYWCRPRRVVSSASPADFDLKWEAVQFPCHGVQLQGWFIPAPQAQAPAPVIILMHGWSHNAVKMLDLAKWIHRDSLAVLLFDGRGHGRSKGDGPSYVLKFCQDILAAVEFLQDRSDVDHQRIGVIGHSIGGAGAILAAAMDKRIAAVVSSSAFSDPSRLTRDTLKRAHIPVWPFLPIIQGIFRRWIGTSIDCVSPLHRIGQIAVPILLAHGASDRLVDPVNLDLLYARANPAQARRLLLDNCQHSEMLNDRTYIEKVIAFLSSTLKSKPLSADAAG